jgi:hypothetical protein
LLVPAVALPVVVVAAMTIGLGGCGQARPDDEPLPAAALRADAPWPGQRVELSVGALRRSAALRASVPTCRREPPVVAPDSVGPWAAGRTLAALLAACPQSARGWDLTYRDLPRPTLATRFGSAAVVAVLADTTADALVGQLETADLSTAEGIGASSPVEDLLATFGAGELIPAGCDIEMTFAARRGMSFRLDVPPGSGLECDDLIEIAEQDEIDRIPPGTAVRHLILFVPGG